MFMNEGYVEQEMNRRIESSTTVIQVLLHFFEAKKELIQKLSSWFTRLFTFYHSPMVMRCRSADPNSYLLKNLLTISAIMLLRAVAYQAQW